MPYLYRPTVWKSCNCKVIGGIAASFQHEESFERRKQCAPLDLTRTTTWQVAMDQDTVVALVRAKHRLCSVEIREPLRVGITQTAQKPDQPVTAANSPTRWWLARRDAGLLQAWQHGTHAPILDQDFVEIEAPLSEARLYA